MRCKWLGNSLMREPSKNCSSECFSCSPDREGPANYAPGGVA